MKNLLPTLLLITIFIAIGGLVVYSENNVCNPLNQSWDTYKNYFIQEDGRVVDYKADNITTSEGESYALMRAVWLNDRTTFDTVLKWTNINLKVRGDSLFSWKWGKNENNNWAVLDKESASDADQDIAMALILAYEAWKDPQYLSQAKNILKDIWNKEVITIGTVNYLLPGPWAIYDDNIKINPSYFAPYAYRIFAKYDKKHDWYSLVDSSYNFLEQSSSLSVFYLPPDWAYINKKTGQITVNNDLASKESDFSYDAIRVMWRLSFDYMLNKDPRALKYLKKSTDYLIKYWILNKNLPGSVTPGGIVTRIADDHSFATYGAVLPAFELVNKDIADQIYLNKISSTYMKGFWADPKDYYAQNIIWFGTSLWTNNNKNVRNQICEKGILNLLNKYDDKN